MAPHVNRVNQINWGKDGAMEWSSQCRVALEKGLFFYHMASTFERERTTMPLLTTHNAQRERARVK